MTVTVSLELPTNASEVEGEELTASDSAWILNNAFLILTMQSGFGLLEAGFVSQKNMANIMVKNVVDVCLGGITYWSVGYALSFGRPSTPFCGYGNFFTAFDFSSPTAGTDYTRYVFQFSFSTAATTIVSGAVAERMKLSAYMIFSVLNTVVYVFPCSWVWNKKGFLGAWGFHDFAGACVVHVTGGMSALVCACMLGPRKGRFEPGGRRKYEMSSPVTALTGLFMLWWAWLAFNCGSTFGIDRGMWKLAAKVGLNTVNGSIGGGIMGIFMSLVFSRGRTFDIETIITGVLGGLVGVTAGCGVMTPGVCVLMGMLCALGAILTNPVKEWLRIDDPVGAVNVHFVAASLSTIGVGLFGSDDHFNMLHNNMAGMLVGGGFRLIGIQLAGLAIICAWSGICTVSIFIFIQKTVGARMSASEEQLGADLVEHKIERRQFIERFEAAVQKSMQQHKEHETNVDEQSIIEQTIDHLIAISQGQQQQKLFTLTNGNGKPIKRNNIVPFDRSL